MHRFQFNQKNAGTPYIYALMNGVYFGGNTERDILCMSPDSPVSNEKRFRLTVSDNAVKLSSNNTTTYINGKAQDTPLTGRTLKHGDLIGVGCQTTQECINDPMCHVFELIKRQPTSSAQRSTSYTCNHPRTSLEDRKSLNHIDCPYPNCLFACWNIVDLNEHLTTSAAHQTAFENQTKPMASLVVQYSAV